MVVLYAPLEILKSQTDQVQWQFNLINFSHSTLTREMNNLCCTFLGSEILYNCLYVCHKVRIRMYRYIDSSILFSQIHFFSSPSKLLTSYIMHFQILLISILTMFIPAQICIQFLQMGHQTPIPPSLFFHFEHSEYCK